MDSAPAALGAGSSTKDAAVRWEIALDSWPRRLAAIVVAIAVAGGVVVPVGKRFIAAWIARAETSDPAIYENALRYDPGNAGYHFRLAQLYNYSTQYINLDRARIEYEAAARLNPERAAYALELSKYYEQDGDRARAREAMQHALATDPNFAQTHWAAANLSIRLDDRATADLELRRTAELDETYITQVLDLVWRFYEDPDRIMATHVPPNKVGNLTALAYFISKASERGAALAWSRLESVDTTPQQRFGYVDYLVGLGKTAEAWRIFSFPKNDLPQFFNGSFETDAMNGGFDWRISSSEAATVRRDTVDVKDGLFSLAVLFSGKENIEFGGQVWHWLAVTKGKSYDLSFWMKTEGISTNEGVFVEVDGQASEKQQGSNYWRQFKIPFTASADLVSARLRRTKSLKFQPELKGKLWVDGFELIAVR